MPPANQGGTRPDPDPTVRTSEQLLREIGLVREITDAKVDRVETVLEARLDAMEKANELVRQYVDTFPSLMATTTHHLETLHNERFKSIDTQLTEKDKRIDQTSRDNNVAVQAAFSAA
jgi:hypothetical protein